MQLLSYVKSMYNIPRYGHSRDITVFFSDDNTLRKDYMLGLILVFTIIMTIAAVWIISLLILRILGHRVGCASGGPATIPAESMSVNQKGSVNTDETGEFIVMQADQNRVNRTRIVFFASVLYSLAACGVLLYSFFMAQGAFQDFYESAEVSSSRHSYSRLCLVHGVIAHLPFYYLNSSIISGTQRRVRFNSGQFTAGNRYLHGV